MALNKGRAVLYDRLHKIAFFSLIGLSGVTAVLLGYNVHLFRKGNLLLKVFQLFPKLIEILSYLKRVYLCWSVNIEPKLKRQWK
jgi:hypothetical protein